jgi:hypothetical protein
MTVLYPWYPFGTPWQQPGTSSPGQKVRRAAAPKQGMRRKRRYTLAGLVLLCLGPCFRGHPRRMPECEANLKMLFTATRLVQRVDTQAGGPTLSAFPYFAPERGNRYAYFLGPGPLEDRSGPDALQVAGQMGIGVDTFKFSPESALTFEDLPPQIAKLVGGQVTDSIYHFTAACAGDTDNNPSDIPDIWTISTRDRMINGLPVAGGEVFQHVNDATTH